MSLQLKKLDLHVHTPASHDFTDKKVTAVQIIEEAKRKGLDAIGIADHNSVDFIDLLSRAAKEKGFKIFPGIEISCGGTQAGCVHVIALFDPSKTRDDLLQVLGLLEIKGKGPEALTEKGVTEVVNIIKKSGGLPILAHANSSHGALSDIKGNPRIELVKNPNLSAVEATSSDFIKEKGKRLIDILDGTDPNYQRKLAVYKSSDNRSADNKGHCLEAIGNEFTIFRMGELTIESLRQCFEDPDSRIIQDYEVEKINSNHPRIISIEINGGFFQNLKLNFHPGMNSTIGGTGTGKSLLIEFLRFAFDKKTHNLLLNDHKEKLLKQLSVGSEVKVTFQDSTGEEYILSRKIETTRDPYTSLPVCINKNTGKPFKGDVSSIFPFLVYSQNEILEITRDPDAQLRLLDTFRDFTALENRINEIIQKLNSNDYQLQQAIQESANLHNLNKQDKNIEEKLKKINKQLSNSGKTTIIDNFLAISEERELLEAKIEEYDFLIEKIQETIKELTAETPTIIKSPKSTLDTITNDISTNYKIIISTLEDSISNVQKAKAKSLHDLKKWEVSKKYAETEEKYKDELQQKKKENQIEAERKTLLKDKKELVQKIAKAEKAAKMYSGLRKERAELLIKLDKEKSGYSKERAEQAALITKKSDEKLKIVIHKGDNKSLYSSRLKKLKTGSLAEKTEIERIVENISPNVLIELILDKDVAKLAKKGKITEQKAENIISTLLNNENILDTLALQYQGYPEDRVEISYQKKDGSYHPLQELSMGQKADALIMIALGDSTMPVIIDQPEDALDIPSIWTDICTRLRISKHTRQFIFTTHNSSISVSSDSDQFIILEADGQKGWIEKAGSIDQKQIKDEIVSHLEGGYKSYELKRKKYGL